MITASPIRGMAAMIVSTAAFVGSDCFMKLVMEDAPPIEVASLRGVGGTFWILLFIVATGQAGGLRWLANPWVIARGLCEVVAVISFVLALATIPLGDVTALYQIAPFILLVAARFIWNEHIGPVKLALIALGFAGAMLVAQPGSSAASPYAVLGLLTALGAAGRDLISRKVPPETPSLVAAAAVIAIVMVATGLVALAFEPVVMPTGRHMLLMLMGGFCLALGQLFIMLAYRYAAPRTIAPFFYMFLFWGVLYGYLFFHEVPNEYALAGMALIVASGLLVIATEPRRAVKPA
jgi:drug/metabolite transporter (DMT)-like permease